MTKRADKPGSRRQPHTGEMIRLMFACYENGSALIDESILLFNHSHFARANANGLLAIQELAKVQVCLGILGGSATYANLNDPDAFWTFWFDHRRKGQEVARAGGALRRIIIGEHRGDAGTSLERFRQRSLYVDMQPPALPVEPTKWVRRHWAEVTIMLANAFLGDLTRAVNAVREIQAPDSKSFAAEFKPIYDRHFSESRVIEDQPPVDSPE